MSADLLVSRAVISPEKFDVHRHATFNCAIARVVRRFMALFS